MRSSSMESIRNVAVVSHAGSGKTSLVEALLYAAGGIPQLGSVLNGTSVCDFEPEEIHRHTSLSTSVAHLTYKDISVNLVDTPGALSFSGETVAALRAVDGLRGDIVGDEVQVHVVDGLARADRRARGQIAGGGGERAGDDRRRRGNRCREQRQRCREQSRCEDDEQRRALASYWSARAELKRGLGEQ